MRALAAALRSAGGQIDAVDSGVYSRVSGLSFTGPAALRRSLLVTEDAVWSIAGVVDARTGDGRIVARRLSHDGLVELLRAFVAP
jgi:hypothetical protein